MPSSVALKQAPVSRYINGGGIDGSKRFYQIAGYSNSNGSLTATSDVVRYDPATDTWGSVASTPGTRNGHAGCQDLQGRVYALFGSVNQNSADGSSIRYDPATNSWSSIASGYGSVSVVAVMDANGDIFVCGGENPQNGVLRKYTVATNSWVNLASLPANRAGGYLSRDASGRLYYICGYDFTQYTTVNTVYRYDPTTNTWASVASCPAAVSGGGAGFDGVNGGRIYVTGGSTNTGYTYNVATNSWSFGPHTTSGHGNVANACASSWFYISGMNVQSGISPTDFLLLNVPPLAATWSAPAEGAVLDRTQPIRTTHVHTDADGDAQASFDLRWRPQGSLGAYMLINTPGTALSKDWAAGTFAGLVEAQIRTYDGEGPGPWSPTRTFSALDPDGASGAPSQTASRLDPMALQAWVNAQRANAPAVVG